MALMELVLSSLVLVVLFPVDAAHSHANVSQGLSCVNDLVNNVSCTWHGSPPAAGVDCWISGEKIVRIRRLLSKQIQRCHMKQHGNSPPGCSFVFENEEFNCYKTMPYIRMECDDALVGNLTDYDPCNHVQMHPLGVLNVSRSANETLISWSLASPHSIFLTLLDFQVQIKHKHQAWKEARTLSTQTQELRIPTGQLTGHCQARGRVKPIDWYKSHWSNWSPTTSWLEATDKETTPHDQDGLLTSLVTWGVVGSLVFLLVAMLVVYRCCLRRGLQEVKLVPNPSKYFHTLYSVHGGNLKKWMNPLSASESFFTAQPREHISPVELCESWDVVSSTSPSSTSTSALLHFKSSAGSDTSGVSENTTSASSSSCFFNMGYFISSSSGSSAQNDPSPAYFTYRDDLHNLHNSHALHLSLCPSFDISPAYESLKREPQSPDSGFCIGKEDEEDIEDNKFACVKRKEVSPLLMLPLRLPTPMFPPSSRQPPPDAPSLVQVAPDSAQVEAPGEAAPGCSYAAWPLAGAMCRSSSMPVETCKTGYLTLKELQTTFSNKSI
ncbi:interleukin-2 receptor subunit beta [Labrus mixtus]|uniref:interleukin-2 receptor subunit beta n=1 Tax=Labrus mixtus TaxID=508554 RepID=UPI0029C0435F|nr:interleukin-2 receptor subunit beta [Labrus mixtus]